MSGDRYYLAEVEGEIALVFDEVAEQAAYENMDNPKQGTEHDETQTHLPR